MVSNKNDFLWIQIKWKQTHQLTRLSRLINYDSVQAFFLLVEQPIELFWSSLWKRRKVNSALFEDFVLKSFH